MAEHTFASPVRLEQIAVLIKRMRPEERQRLLALVPELRQDAMQPKRTIEDARKNVEILKKEILSAIGGKPLSPDEPFLDGLTLGEYLDLPESEQAKLWDKWTQIDLDDLNEVEVRPDAVPAR